MAISGLGVAMATGGGLLLYAGLRGTTPLQALRDVTTGKRPGAVSTTPGNPGDASGGAGPSSGGGFPQLVAAARQFSGDKYSQARRWQAGYSDCSSFVGKAFKSLGITPPGASTTWDYLAWRALTKIQPGQVGPGDLIVNQVHMVIATSTTTAIGQENPRRNVQEDTITALMMGTGSYTCLRYMGG